MSTPFLGQITFCAFGFAPKGFALCNGQLLAINQNQALFALLGTTFGGDGRTTFALPNLQGRVSTSFGNGFNLGEQTGTEMVTLTVPQMPAHTHALTVSNSASPLIATVSGNTVGVTGSQNYSTSAPNAVMDGGSTTNNGSSQQHENRSPFLVVNCVIALQGIFPSQS